MKKIIDRLHKVLSDEPEVNKILIDFGFKWLIFGLVIGYFIGKFL